MAQRAGSLARLLAKNGKITRLPGPGAQWTAGRDAPVPPAESFRTWWKRNHD
jgi:L-lactate dehydrogenase complex protein LldF